MKRETIAIHVGYDGDPTTKAVAVPIYQTIAFEFDSAEHGAALFNLEVEGNIYTRIGNPTNTVLEKRVAALEGGVDALSVSSGMAAIEYSIINIAEMGNNIVSLPQLYGATYTLFAHVFAKRGITARFAESDCPNAVEKLIDENTRAVFCESIGNPAGNVADIEGLARVAHKHGVPLIVDNTIATPILLRPIEYGADVVVHSMTKFMGGHGTTLGGMIVDSGKFPWRDYPERFYMLNRPEPAYHGVVYVEHYGDAAYVARCRTVAQRNTGATLSPFNGFLLLQGVETLALRVERHVENARKVAEYLRDHEMVEWVNYVGFPDNPLYPMAQRYLGCRRCSLLTFGVKGGFEAGKKCFNALRLFKRMVNNMPDPALEDSEQQFFELLDFAAGDIPVSLRLYSLPGIPRGDRGQERLRSLYHDVHDLLHRQFDACIITGTEPHHPNLREEPYWATLADVLDWAERSTISTVLSCLAAHASVLHSDGIERHKLSDKQFGVFEFRRVRDHGLMSGMADRVRIPHSHWNEVREDALTTCGYVVLTKSAEAGVDSFVKKKKESLFVHFQGHPVYSARTLLKEYRRDIRRLLKMEREVSE